METVLVSLLTLVMLIVSTLVMFGVSLKSVNTISDSFQAMEKQSISIQMTSIDLVYDSLGGGVLAMDVLNRGQSDLKDYPLWNVLVALADGTTTLLSYTTELSPADNEWTVQSMWMTQGVPEVFGLGLLNPGERMTILLNVSPALESRQAVLVTVATPNGISAQCQLITP